MNKFSGKQYKNYFLSIINNKLFYLFIIKMLVLSMTQYIYLLKTLLYSKTDLASVPLCHNVQMHTLVMFLGGPISYFQANN